MLRCQRAPDCGDGYSCDAAGLCHAAVGQAGDICHSEADCAAGLSCQIDSSAVDRDNLLIASCTAENSTRSANDMCDDDSDCRNGTCALGRCVDLCHDTRDCASGTACAIIPRVAANGELFDGCLPTSGALVWQIPVTSPGEDIMLPIPNNGFSAELVMSIDDPSQEVGVSGILSPAGARIYQVPCFAGDPSCQPDVAADQYFTNTVRHLPGFDQSVLMMPASPNVPLENGAYRIRVSSFRANGEQGSAVPRVTALVQLNTGVLLDLHFFFLDLADHPCLAGSDIPLLDAANAAQPASFQNSYIADLRTVFAAAGLAIGEVTYDDVVNRPDVDGLDISDAGSLLALGSYPTGINIFFVRSLSPVGLAAFGPNPGPAGIAGTPQSGIAISLDSLCYGEPSSQWNQLALLTAHEIARYMGLYHNVELATPQHPKWRDPINDGDDSTTNLMYFTGPTGSDLSAGQRAMLTRSGAVH